MALYGVGVYAWGRCVHDTSDLWNDFLCVHKILVDRSLGCIYQPVTGAVALYIPERMSMTRLIERDAWVSCSDCMYYSNKASQKRTP